MTTRSRGGKVRSSDNRAREIAAVMTRLVELLAVRDSDSVEPIERRPLPERVLLTVKEAAERLGVGRTTAYALVASGELESVRIGNLRRIHVDAVHAYAARLVANNSPTVA